MCISSLAVQEVQVVELRNCVRSDMLCSLLVVSRLFCREKTVTEGNTVSAMVVYASVLKGQNVKVSKACL